MPSEAQSQIKFKAGDIVYTLYGAGVIVSTEPTSNSVESPDVDNHDRTVETPLTTGTLFDYGVYRIAQSYHPLWQN
jgi:hypothetical protein